MRGKGFADGAKVVVDGTERATTFVSADELTTTLAASDVAAAGERAVTVANPADRGGPSEAVRLTVR